jgi:hypothetical protein
MSSRVLFDIYLFVLVLTVINGFIRYRRFDTATRILLLLLIVTTISEFVCKYRANNHLGKAPVYHFYNIAEIILTTAYFLKTIKSYHFFRIMLISAVVWPVLGIINLVYLQPINKFNSNILMLESICIIAMSLYSLYKILLNDTLHNVLKYPHFWIWSIQLFFWSSSFFFWGYYEVLMQKGWALMPSFAKAQAIINILVYFGIGLTFLFYPKSSQPE